MTTELVYAFEGSLPDDVLQRNDVHPASLLEELQVEASPIAEEIRESLETVVPHSNVEVHIQFVRGSVDWFGVIVAGIEGMSVVGGAVGFIQLVRSAINRSIRRRVPANRPDFYISTLVTLIQADTMRSYTQHTDTRLRDPRVITSLVLSAATFLVTLTILTILSLSG